MKRLLFLIAAGLLGLVAWSSFFTVEEGHLAIVSRFGAPKEVIAHPGLHLKWPAPIEEIQRLDGRVSVLNTERAEFLTRDKKNVTVDAFLAWRVGDPLRFTQSIPVRSDAHDRLEELALSALGEVLAERNLDELLGATEDSGSAGQSDSDGQPPTHGLESADVELSRRIQESAAEGFGVELLSARIQRLSFPRQNKAAVFLRMEADRQAIASTYRAEGAEAYEKITAAAEREAAELIAAAEEEAARIRAEAEADVTRIATEAYARDPELFRFLRSLETLEAAVDAESTVVLPADHPLLEVLKSPPDDSPGGDE